MLLSFSKLKLVRFQILSKQIYRLPVHWLGRTVVCAGVDCPACVYRLPRDVFFFGSCSNRQRRVCEVPSSLAMAIDAAAAAHFLPDLLGLILDCKRYSCRDCWKIVDSGHRAPLSSPLEEYEVAGAAATAFRLPQPGRLESFKEWHFRVAPTQVKVLQQCHLFA
jgi:hypothetical protein